MNPFYTGDHMESKSLHLTLQSDNKRNPRTDAWSSNSREFPGRVAPHGVMFQASTGQYRASLDFEQQPELAVT